jgi:hypothetical protein
MMSLQNLNIFDDARHRVSGALTTVNNDVFKPMPKKVLEPAAILGFNEVVVPMHTGWKDYVTHPTDNLKSTATIAAAGAEVISAVAKAAKLQNLEYEQELQNLNIFKKAGHWVEGAAKTVNKEVLKPTYKKVLEPSYNKAIKPAGELYIKEILTPMHTGWKDFVTHPTKNLESTAIITAAVAKAALLQNLYDEDYFPEASYIDLVN